MKERRLHQTFGGGFLKIHADFNWHDKLKLDRRINVLIYLNKDWNDEYGGHLELWDRAMTRCEVRELPVFNRMVVFNTTTHSFHGHPDPLDCPQEMTRKSIAMYYYTNGRPAHEKRGQHSTLYQRRREDAFSVGVQTLLQELVPPILIRGVRKFVRRS